MRLVSHLIAADVRHLRGLLSLWLLVVAAVAANDGLAPLVATAPLIRDTLGIASNLLWLTKFLLTFIVVSGVIHAHPVVGSDAFWMTRPIPAAALLTSKLVLLCLTLAVAPVSAEAVLVASYQVPFAVGLGVIAQSLLFHTLWVIALATGAALTSNLARFGLLCGATAVGVVLLLAISAAFQVAQLDDRPIVASRETGDDPTGLVVFETLASAALLSTLVVLYRTRTVRHAVFAGGASALVAVFALSAWPWPLLAVTRRLPPSAGKPDAWQLIVEEDTIATNTAPTIRVVPGSEWRRVNGRVSVSGADPGWFADIALVDASLRVDISQSLSSLPGYRSGPLPFAPDDEYAARSVARQLLGVAVPGRMESPILFTLPAAEYASYAPVSGAYRARFDVVFTRHELEGTLPLKPGAVHQSGGYRLIVDRVTQSGSDVLIVARESRATSVWERRPAATYSYYLRNRQRGEAVIASEVPVGPMLSLLRLLPVGDVSFGSSYRYGFMTRAIAVSFPPRYDSRAETLEADAPWLAAAELVIVRRTREGSVERDLRVSAFPLGNNQRSATSVP